jgi:PAS domain S-box-containing protein
MAERMNGFQKPGSAPRPGGTASDRAEEGFSRGIFGAKCAAAGDFQSLADRLPIGVFRMAPDGRLLWANRAMLGLLRADSVEELAKRLAGGRPFQPDYTNEWLMEKCEKEGEIRGLESTWQVGPATLKVRQNIRAALGPDGKIQYFEGSAEDITAKKNEEESLRAKADFLEEVVTNATVGIFVIDEDNRYVLINPECGRIVGRWPDDWTGREAGLHVHPEDAGKAMAHFIQAVTGEQNEFELRIEASDGAYKHCRVNLSPMMLGERAHVLGVVSDITDRKNSEEAMLQKRSQNLNIILVGALTEMALRMPPGELERSMQDFERWFGKRFEKIIEEDLELISGYEPAGEKDMEGPELVVRRFLRFYASLLAIYGIRTECTFGPSSSTFEILDCAWLKEAKLSPVPCRVCRTIMCGSFVWTGLEGSAEQTVTIAGGFPTCKFVFKPGPPRHHLAE